MKAVFYARRGPAREVLEFGAIPTPQPLAGQVRVRLHASGVNPSDWKSRSGLTAAAPLAAAVIPHSDGAGVIDAVGAGVDAARIGERVWVWNGQWQRPHGTAAQYIALPSAQAVTLPANTDFEAGACLGIPVMTALQAIRLTGVHAGATVLVHGGAGSVSHYAIQFARARGIRVLTTVSSDLKARHALAAGADAAINYRTDSVGDRVSELTKGSGVDAVIDVNYSANAVLLPNLIRPHGRVVVYGSNEAECRVPGLWLMRNSVTVASFLVYDLDATDRAAVLDGIGDALKGGRLSHTIAATLPLDAAAEAHEMVERGAVIGNVVLRID